MTSEQIKGARVILEKLIKIHDDGSPYGHTGNFDKCGCHLAQGIRDVGEYLDSQESNERPIKYDNTVYPNDPQENRSR